MRGRSLCDTWDESIARCSVIADRLIGIGRRDAGRGPVGPPATPGWARPAHTPETPAAPASRAARARAGDDVPRRRQRAVGAHAHPGANVRDPRYGESTLAAAPSWLESYFRPIPVRPLRSRSNSFRVQLPCKREQPCVDRFGRLILRTVASVDRDAAHVDAEPLRGSLRGVAIRPRHPRVVLAPEQQ